MRHSPRLGPVEARPSVGPASSVTVVIPTWRRPELLQRCLGGVLSQEPGADEVLVVARPNDAEARSIIERASVDAPVRWVAVTEPGHVPPVRAGLDATTTSTRRLHRRRRGSRARVAGGVDRRHARHVSGVRGRLRVHGGQPADRASRCRQDPLVRAVHRQCGVRRSESALRCRLGDGGEQLLAHVGHAIARVRAGLGPRRCVDVRPRPLSASQGRLGVEWSIRAPPASCIPRVHATAGRHLRETLSG